TYMTAFLTMRCNLNCSFCLNAFSKDFNRTKFREISGKQWVEALNKLESREDLPITFSGGEPFLHPDFIYILNNLKPELKIDILTNFYDKNLVDRFISEINPERVRRQVPYPSIRVSYHPEQMDAEQLITNVKKAADAGFNIGIETIMYPNPRQLEAIEQMAIQCRNLGISLRPKSFTGVFEGEDNKGDPIYIVHGNYSKYPKSFSQSPENLKNCSCKTSELLIAPDGKVYRCHRDLFSEENFTGNITDENFQVEDKFRECNKYGQCHPCDVKLKTNYKQQLGHTSVEIKNLRE
ncbi:MAG: radical SAM/SPASM domain-containing protein, partial [Nanoarchaeota archaeon]